jgi:hypothetical protein
VCVSERAEAEPWYAVRCVFRFEPEEADEPGTYEERITLWRASSPEAAISRAEADAQKYVEALGDCKYVKLAQSFHLAVRDGVEDGDEVFSLMRSSHLPPNEYLTRFFDTGDEFQGTVS